MRKNLNGWVLTVIILAVGIASYSLYGLLSKVSQDILLMFGIDNYYIQNFIFVFIVLLLLLALGSNLEKSINKIIK